MNTTPNDARTDGEPPLTPADHVALRRLAETNRRLYTALGVRADTRKTNAEASRIERDIRGVLLVALGGVLTVVVKVGYDFAQAWIAANYPGSS